MDAAEQSTWRGRLVGRHAAVADRWFRAVAGSGFAPAALADVRRELSRLTTEVVAALLDEPFTPARARAAGAALAALHYLTPAALGGTVRVLAEELLADAPPAQAAAAQPRLAWLLGEVGAGFYGAAQDRVLAGQEAARAASSTARQRAEAALRASEGRLHLVTRHLPAHLWTTDAELRLTSFLGGGFAGREAETRARLGLDLYAFFRTEDPDFPPIAAHRRALAGAPAAYELALDGRQFEVRVEPLRGDGGRIVGCVGLGVDVTARRKEEARLRTIVEGAPIGIVLTDTARHVLAANPAAQRFLGHDEATLQTLPVDAHTHPDDRAAGLALSAALLAGRRDYYQREKRYRRPDGGARWGRLTVALVRDAAGRPHHSVSMIEDITAQKTAEAELAATRRRLLASREAAQGDLARELHDGPLQRLFGLAYQLEMLADALPDAAGRARLAAGLAGLEGVAGELRAICRELRPPTLAPFGLAAAFRAHAERVQAAHPGLALDLDLRPDGQDLPEEARLALFRIGQEALHNAVRHAAPRAVAVRLRWDGARITLTVRDDGAGFAPPARWAELVERGHLGLAGARERAEALGGRLAVRSRPGRGTVVRATIPREGV